jgi:hypothetical protein
MIVERGLKALCQIKEDWPTLKAECRRQNYILDLCTTPIHYLIPCRCYGFFGHNDVTGRGSRLSGLEPIFKITDLNIIVDDRISFVLGYQRHQIEIAKVRLLIKSLKS